MGIIFDTDCFGKKDIVSQYAACTSCQKTAVLSSYTAHRFVHLNQFPLFPLGRMHVADQCPHCGHRNMVANRTYQHQRKQDLAQMMNSFTEDADNPDVTLNGLQTLMVHNQETWFLNVVETYGMRFETDIRVQLKIARGLHRFGHYGKAGTYCQKAIALGAGAEASVLLTECQTMKERSEAHHIDLAGVQPESMLRPYAFIIFLTLAMMGSLAFMIKSAMRHHTALLVNGLPISYNVEIDGTVYPLEPYELKRVMLRLGKHEMLAHGLTRQTEPVSFKYTLSLLEQKRGNQTLVLNPDQLALLVAETAPGEGTAPAHYFGESVRILDEVSQLRNKAPAYPLEVEELLRAKVGPDAADRYTHRMLEEVPGGDGTEDLLSVIVEKMSLEDAAVFLKQGMRTATPILAWHVFYQDYVKSRCAAYDLENEYALLCEKHPDEPEYYYLLGRVVRNRDSAKLLFEKSLQGRGSDGMGCYAIARDLLCSGQFPAARPYAMKALAKAPDNRSFIALVRQIQLALRQYDNLLESTRSALASDPDNGLLMAEQIKYLTLLGEHQAVGEATQRFSGPEGRWGAYFNAARFYVVGNTADYLANMAISEMKDAAWQKHLHTGNLKEAHEALSTKEQSQNTDPLLLYCASRYHKQSESADAAMAQAIARMSSSTGPQQAMAYMLSQPSPPTVRQILDLRIWPEDKAVLCAALGFRFPRHQTAFFKLSQNFNYAPEFPQLLLKKWTRSR